MCRRLGGICGVRYLLWFGGGMPAGLSQKPESTVDGKTARTLRCAFESATLFTLRPENSMTKSNETQRECNDRIDKNYH